MARRNRTEAPWIEIQSYRISFLECAVASIPELVKTLESEVFEPWLAHAERIHEAKSQIRQPWKPFAGKALGAEFAGLSEEATLPGVFQYLQGCRLEGVTHAERLDSWLRGWNLPTSPPPPEPFVRSWAWKAFFNTIELWAASPPTRGHAPLTSATEVTSPTFVFQPTPDEIRAANVNAVVARLRREATFHFRRVFGSSIPGPDARHLDWTALVICDGQKPESVANEAGVSVQTVRRRVGAIRRLISL